MTNSQILISRLINEEVRAKNLEIMQWFVDSSKTFDSLHRENMGQILIVHDLPKETIIMFYKNTKAMVCSPYAWHWFLWECRRHLAKRYIRNICRVYVQWKSADQRKENGFKQKKNKKQTLLDRNYHGCRFRRLPTDSRKYTSPSSMIE